MGNEEKEIMITIPLARYEELHDLETRATILMEYTQKQNYSVDREMIALCLNFNLNKHEIPKKPMSFTEMLGEESNDGKCNCGEEA